MKYVARYAWWWITLAGLVAYIADRVVKNWFIEHPTNVVDILQPYLYLQFQLNTSMALSLPLWPWLYYPLVTIIATVLLVTGVRAVLQKNLIEYSVVLFILIGAVSNLLDRFLYGGVIDFITISFWSVFNLADMYIVVAVGLWIFSSVRTTAATSKPIK